MRSDLKRVRYALGGPLTPVVRMLMWINGAVFVFLWIAGRKIFKDDLSYLDIAVSLFGLSPDRFFQDWAVWQLFTYMFIHTAFYHLLFNLLGLWWFGSDLESHWGSRRFMHYYFFTGIGAGLVSAFLGIPTIGASGAIFGLLLGYGMMFPNRVLYLYFVLPVKAKWCVMIFGGLELVMLMMDQSGQVNHAAHVSGLVFGALWLFFERRGGLMLSWMKDYKRRRMRKRLRIVKSDKKRKDSNDDPFDNFTNHTIH